MGDAPLVYVGIDLSTSNSTTGVCRINWDDETMEVGVASRLTVAEVLDKEFTAAAIDVPFGWPVDFVAAVRAWSDRGQRGASDGSDAGRDDEDIQAGSSGDDPGKPLDATLFRVGYEAAGERLRFRATDRFVRKAMKADAREERRQGWPSGLSVTKDMITGTALHAMHLLGSRYPDLVVGCSFETAPHPVVEAYPSTALRGWGLEVPPYKGSEGRSGRSHIIEQLAEVSTLRGPIEAHREVLEDNDNLLDAFICALVARSWHRGHTYLPDEAAVELMGTHCPDWFDELHFYGEVVREGWIAHPSTDLHDALSD